MLPGVYQKRTEWPVATRHCVREWKAVCEDPLISITVQNLVKRFEAFLALDRVSLQIDSGELFFLLGPSGCGKTTLLRNIAGFHLPDEGRIFFGDQEVTRMPAHKRNTGMMFQSYALWPHMSVFQNVAFGLVERGVARSEVAQRVAAALEMVRMGGYAERRIPQLSGGQQQRVALARALVVRPRCLLLDEPLSNLDAKLRLEMRGEIRRVCKEFGLTAIYVTHDQKEALSIADRMAVLHGGRIAQVGRPAEIYRRPKSTLVADFIGETNFMRGKILSVSAECGDVETSLGLFRGVVSDEEWRPQPGEEAILSIRPECWQIGAARRAVNCAAGRIGEAIYLGELAQYRFVTDGQELKIFELNPPLDRRPSPEELHVFAEPADVSILRC